MGMWKRLFGSGSTAGKSLPTPTSIPSTTGSLKSGPNQPAPTASSSNATSPGETCAGCGKKLNPVHVGSMGPADDVSEQFARLGLNVVPAKALADQIKQKPLYCSSCRKTYCTSCGMKRPGADFTCPDCGSVIS